MKQCNECDRKFCMVTKQFEAIRKIKNQRLRPTMQEMGMDCLSRIKIKPATSTIMELMIINYPDKFYNVFSKLNVKVNGGRS